MDEAREKDSEEQMEREAILAVGAVGLGRYQMRRFAAKRPRLFFPLYGLARDNRRLMIGGDTELVIEGFPRSGNTFTVVAFEMAQRNPVRIAHHLHAQAQVMRAAERNIPTVVLIRRPADAVRSLVVRHPHIPLGLGLEVYAEFYSDIHYARNRFLVATFDDVTRDLAAVTERVNRRFGTNFGLFRHSEENLKEVFDRIERINTIVDGGSEAAVARPSAAKDRAKTALSFDSGRHARLLARAEDLYNAYASLAREAV